MAPSINRITRKKASSEVGEGQLNFLEGKFVKYLFPDLQDQRDLSYRVAPSIVCRSEAEVLAVSSPRFAVRAILSDGGIVNLRRLPMLKRTVPNWTERTSNNNETLEYLSGVSLEQADSPEEVIQSNIDAPGRAIADCLLVPTKKVQDKYFVQKTNLLAAYDEYNVAAVTPFIRHLKLSGGLCAQATCFMAVSYTHLTLPTKA